MSGWLWLAGATVAALGQGMPGVTQPHPVLFWTLLAVTLAYAAGSITRLIPWERVSLAGHAAAVAALQPVVVAALWLTGGQDSYMLPMLVLPMFYVAYFFPPVYAWPLATLEVATAASPLLTAREQGNHLLVAGTFAYAVSYAGVMITIGFLKRRLIAAERHQHRMARMDPLTGLANRRAFDEALSLALESGERFALLLADVDSFKQINDGFGHTTGDRVLRELAAHASGAVRGGDCLARIGGDELALVAPGAGAGAAERLVAALRAAAAHVDTGFGPLSLTIAAVVHPRDGLDRFTLMRTLDLELHAIKNARASAR
ncbi:MAG TPA: GGDEF domain-containing protein [Solirubrobacter sp.]|nr:GGDEF domain-containing protein [Solirubrobacter sp.]